MTARNSLVGKCFVIFGYNSAWSRQGVVRHDLSGGYYLVQFFDAFMGLPNTSAIFHISQMVDQNRAKGGWEFFENDEHLREWIGDRD